MSFEELEKRLRDFLTVRYFSIDYVDEFVPLTIQDFRDYVALGKRDHYKLTFIFDDKKGHQTECTLRI